MSTKERILTIRLISKIEKYPIYAKVLGIEANGAVKNQNRNEDPKGLVVK